MTIAQQWQMVAPPTATPPTTCHANIASIQHSPQTPPQGEGLPSIAALVRRSPPKNAGIESVSSFERARHLASHLALTSVELNTK